ncbi:metal-dependent hydrolase [Alteribacillus sp. HJP-4]|uniref:metal-dependent hydrolase n=1 Tax=Alteribacillus sp. HJP-4 TaxID=2775394 RepID=UPI0035CD00CE
MNAGTHLIGAAAAGTALFAVSPPDFALWSPNGAFFSASVLGGGLLPDICQPTSWLGRRLRIISTLIRTILGHRTFTHSLLFLLLIYLTTGLWQGNAGSAVQLGLTLGAASHILLDMLTVRGVRLLFPVRINVRFPLTTTTGSVFGEGVIAISLLVWVIYFTANMV